MLGAAFLAVTGIIDKVILEKYVRSPLAYLVVLVVLQQIFIIPIPIYAGLDFVYPQSLYALALGGAQVILWAAYLRALQVEETSRVAALVYVFPVFVFLGEFFLLGEILREKDYVGGALLVLSAFLISYHPANISPANMHSPIAHSTPTMFSPALKYMTIFWIFTAIYVLASKYLLLFMDEWHVIFWSSLGSLAAVLPLLGRKEIYSEVKGYFRGGRILLYALVADEIFDLMGRGAFIFAYAVGSVSLVSSVSALQPFITLVYVIALGLFYPGILSEEMDRRTISIKTIAIILIASGIYLIS